MVGNQLPFAEATSINKPQLFCGMNYPFWKFQMKFFMEYVNRGIWNVVVKGYTIPTQLVEGKIVEKPFESWFVDEIRRAKYDSKAMNIIHFTLNCDEFFRVLAYSTTKEMWDLIQVTHEGT